jgi:thiol-disulfide isomerase/thioredoxin
MKKSIIVIAALFIYSNAFCQYDTTPPYLKDKMLPAFNLLNSDSALFTHKILSTGKTTIIMLYNPECGHCQDQMDLLLSLPEIITNTQIVLTSSQPLFKIKTFYQKNKLEQYPNIFAGKDYAWFFGKFFQPKTIPVLAVYNKQNKFVFISQGNATKKQLLEAIK